MKKIYIFLTFFCVIASLQFISAQNFCASCAGVPAFTVNLSSNPNNTYTVSSVRNNICCQGSGSDNCIVFYVTVHPSATEIKFFKSGGNNGNYQINCSPPTYNPTNPVCLNGLTQFCITYCNPGNNSDTYTITTSSGFSVSPNFTVNNGCSAKMYVSGLNLPSITWNSINPGPSGAYNSYLSCLSGCDTTIVTPPVGAPPFIDYVVCGTKVGCASGIVCDTVRVYTAPSLSVSITPTNPVICSPATSIALTASVTGGTAPYSYTWSPGSVLSPSVAAGLGTYTVRVSDGATGCLAKTATVTVSSGTTPPSPIPGSNSPICAGQNLSLTASSVAGATLYSWSGPSSFTSSLQNPSISNATLTNAGTYSVFATVGGCNSLPSSISVSVNNAPASPTAGSNGPICAGQTLSLTASTISGATYSWSGPNSFTSTLQNPSITNASTLATGVYSVFASVGGCNGPIGTISVTINGIPATPTPSNNSPLCVGQTLNLTSGAVTGGSYSWIGPNSFSANTQNASVTNAQTTASGVYTLVVTVNGCSSLPGITTATVSPPPAAPTAGSNGPICAGQTLSLTASTIIGATYNWSGPNAFASTLQNPSITNASTLSAGVYSVFATIGGCTGPIGTVSVTVNGTPAAPTAGSNGPICAGQILNLTASNILGATYNWSGPNSFTSTLQNPSITNASTLATGVYSVSASVNGCNGPAGTISVTVNGIPATPIPSNNSPLCVGQTLNLTTGAVTGASYSWSGPNSFNATTQNASIVNAQTAASGVYTLVVTVNGCSSSPGVTTVSVNPPPAAPTAGSNGPICAGQTLSLTAGTISGATYSWSGPNSFTSTLQNPSITNASTLATGVYSVFASIGGCNGPLGVIAVTINPSPSAPVLNSNSPLCINQTLSLTASSIASATYTWVGPNGFNSTLQNPIIVNTTTLMSGTYSAQVTVNGCSSSVAVTNVTVSNPAVVNAGSNQVVCANNSIVLLNGASSTNSGTWTSSGTGTFAPNTFTGSYLPSSADITNGSVTLTLTSTNNGGCPAQSAQLTVSITPAPTANAGITQTVCANNATVNLNGSVTLATGGVWSSSGTGTFIPNNTSLNTSYVPSSADISVGSVVFTLSTTGNGNCLSVTATKTVIITPAPVVNGGPATQIVCKNNPNYQLNATSSTGSASWTTLGTGTFSASNTILNPLYLSSTADTTNGSVILILTSTNNGGCNAVSQTITLLYTSTITANAGTPQSVCANNATISLNGVATTSAGIWTSSGNGTFVPSSSSLVTSYIPSSADIANGFVNFTLTTTNNGGCNPITSQVNVTITPAPTASAGTNQTVCANNATIALNGAFNISAGAQWSSSGTGTFVPSNTSMNTSYIASPADTTSGSVVLSLVTTGNGNCNAVTSTVQVNFNPAPLVVAGNNFAVCKNNPVAQLSGYSSTGSGTWTTLGTGTFVPNNAILNPTYTPSTADTTAGSVMLVFTSVNNGGCNAVSDTVLLTFSGIPTVTAGSNQTVCANNATVNLNGVSSTGSGTWITSGTGSFVPNAIGGNYVPSSTDISNGVIQFTVTTTNNGGCNAVTSTMTVDVSPAPVSMAGNSQTICASNASVALSGSVTIASGGIWSSSGTGTFNPSNASLVTSYYPSSADTAAGSVMLFLTTTGNGNCIPVVDTLYITFDKPAFVNAGSDLNICKNQNQVNLSGVTSASSVTWTTLGSGVFQPGNTNPVTGYLPSSADTLAGSVQLVLMADGTGACGVSYDTLTVNFLSLPKANFVNNGKCINTALSFTNTTTVASGTINSWIWYFNSDTSTAVNPVYTFTSAGTHTVSLVVSNGCTDSLSRTIFINALPQASFSFATTCSDTAKFNGSGIIAPGNISGWSWNFGDSTTSNLQNPVHVYADTGSYIVNFTVVSDSGCVASVSDTVRLRLCNDLQVLGNPAVPSGFTPNSDGKNDILFVKGGPYKALELRVYNEWGNEIFKSSKQSDGWDGTFRGALQPPGRYLWVLTAERIDGKQYQMSGEVFLTR